MADDPFDQPIKRASQPRLQPSFGQSTIIRHELRTTNKHLSIKQLLAPAPGSSHDERAKKLVWLVTWSVKAT